MRSMRIVDINFGFSMVGFNVFSLLVIVWSFGNFARINFVWFQFFCFDHLLCLFGLISICEHVQLFLVLKSCLTMDLGLIFFWFWVGDL